MIRPAPKLCCCLMVTAVVACFVAAASPSAAAQAATGYRAIPARKTPLDAPPQIVALAHLGPEQMKPQDAELAESLRAEIATRAALHGFDLSRADWHYEQIACPVLRHHVALAFSHGPDPNGSSRFVAVLPRDGNDVRIFSTFSHGFRPFSSTSAWERDSKYDSFNRVLASEEGERSLASRPDWLTLGLCYAELSGYPVQVLAATNHPDDTLDLERLNANRPQLAIAADRSAKITFSDVSEPAVTTEWTISFDRRGQLVSATRRREHQPSGIALKP